MHRKAGRCPLQTDYNHCFRLRSHSESIADDQGVFTSVYSHAQLRSLQTLAREYDFIDGKHCLERTVATRCLGFERMNNYTPRALLTPRQSVKRVAICQGTNEAFKPHRKHGLTGITSVPCNACRTVTSPPRATM